MILQVVETRKDHSSKRMIGYDFEQKIGALRFFFFDFFPTHDADSWQIKKFHLGFFFLVNMYCHPDGDDRIMGGVNSSYCMFHIRISKMWNFRSGESFWQNPSFFFWDVRRLFV